MFTNALSLGSAAAAHPTTARNIDKLSWNDRARGPRGSLGRRIGRHSKMKSCCRPAFLLSLAERGRNSLISPGERGRIESGQQARMRRTKRSIVTARPRQQPEVLRSLAELQFEEYVTPSLVGRYVADECGEFFFMSCHPEFRKGPVSLEGDFVIRLTFCPRRTPPPRVSLAPSRWRPPWRRLPVASSSRRLRRTWRSRRSTGRRTRRGRKTERQITNQLLH